MVHHAVLAAVAVLISLGAFGAPVCAQEDETLAGLRARAEA